MTIQVFCLLTCLAWCSVPPVRTVAGEAQETSSQVGQHTLTRLCRVIDTATGRVDQAVTDQLLSTEWPDEVMSTVCCAVSRLVQKPNVRLNATSVREFALRHKEKAAVLVPYLAQALPEAERVDAVHLLIAVREIGPQARSLENVIVRMSGNSDPVLAIHAATALARIAPAQEVARLVLLKYLSDRQPENRWRAAYAVGHARVDDDNLLKCLEGLLADEDVRVRVTSAFALGRTTKDFKRTLPVLVKSLEEQDLPLATGYVHPSDLGFSHRAYAISAILDTGRHAEHARSALPRLVSIVKEVASTESMNSVVYVHLGLAALHGIRGIGPISATEYKQLKAAVQNDGSAFSCVRDEAMKVIATIKARDSDTDCPIKLGRR